jgi:hypothetical protein
MPFQLEEKSCEGLNAMLHSVHEQNELKPRSRQSKIVGLLPNQKNWNKRVDQEMQREKLLDSSYIKTYLMPFDLRDARDMSKIDKKGADLEMPFYGLHHKSMLREDAIDICNYVFSKIGFKDQVSENGLFNQEQMA